MGVEEMCFSAASLSVGLLVLVRPQGILGAAMATIPRPHPAGYFYAALCRDSNLHQGGNEFIRRLKKEIDQDSQCPLLSSACSSIEAVLEVTSETMDPEQENGANKSAG